MHKRMIACCAFGIALLGTIAHAQTMGEDRNHYQNLSAPEIPASWDIEWKIDSPPPPVGIEDLIDELGAESFAKRQHAESALTHIGKPAAPELEKAVASDDPELRIRATRILKSIPPDRRTWHLKLHEYLSEEAITGVVSPQAQQILELRGSFSQVDYESIRDDLVKGDPVGQAKQEAKVKPVSAAVEQTEFGNLLESFEDIQAPAKKDTPPKPDPELNAILAIFAMRSALGAERTNQALAAFSHREAQVVRIWLGLLAHDTDGEPAWLVDLKPGSRRAIELSSWQLDEHQQAFLTRGAQSHYPPLKAHCERWQAYLKAAR
ncbi:MAG: hypothetical protein ACI9TH_001871 [Kiritimatiellia bacterium]|jgi:hypothetical protein